MDKLAIFDGSPVFDEISLTRYNPIGFEEVEAVTRVVRSGCLSGYIGSWCDEFYGGPIVQALESNWARKIGVKHAIAVNPQPPIS